MATLALTWAINTNAGSGMRALAHAIQKASENCPDTNSSGASVVLTIDNAPATGIASVVVSGPYPSNQTYIVG